MIPLTRLPGLNRKKYHCVKHLLTFLLKATAHSFLRRERVRSTLRNQVRRSYVPHVFDKTFAFSQAATRISSCPRRSAERIRRESKQDARVVP